MTRYGRSIGWLLGSWLLFSLTASALHWYRPGLNQPPLVFGLAALTPIVVFLAWFGVSKEFRAFALSLNPRILTFLQSWRIVGYVFLVLAAYGILPKVFALPAGWGDIVIGATAPLVALKLANRQSRRGFVLWQFLGIMDLVSAVTLGPLARVIDPAGIPTTPMTVLPLSLIPTFAVPLLFIFHIICIAQSHRLPDRQSAMGQFLGTRTA